MVIVTNHKFHFPCKVCFCIGLEFHDLYKIHFFFVIPHIMFPGTFKFTDQLPGFFYFAYQYKKGIGTESKRRRFGTFATSILRNLHMSFVYYVNVSVIGYVLGACAAIFAGMADRYGRANIVAAGLGITGLLCVAVLPNVHSSLGFAAAYISIVFVEGVILVATPALVRDFSPQLGRASAMGLSSSVGVLRVAKENWVSRASETRVTETLHSLSAIARIAASPAAKVGNR